MALAYTPFKIFHYSDTLNSMSSETGTPEAPIHVRIKPINMCNHHCWYCAYKAEDLQLGGDMNKKDQIPEDKMTEIAEDLVNMGVKAVTFSGGGEPFLYEPLLKVSKILVDGGIQIASLTNGSKLEGEFAEYYAKHATWLRISLDAWDDASYTASRGVRDGEFQSLLKRICDFVNLKGTCVLGVSLIVDQKNAEHVYEIVQLLRESGVHNVKFSPVLLVTMEKKTTFIINQSFPQLGVKYIACSKILQVVILNSLMLTTSWKQSLIRNTIGVLFFKHYVSSALILMSILTRTRLTRIKDYLDH